LSDCYGYQPTTIDRRRQGTAGGGTAGILCPDNKFRPPKPLTPVERLC
jgi:hypothetical protein